MNVVSGNTYQQLGNTPQKYLTRFRFKFAKKSRDAFARATLPMFRRPLDDRTETRLTIPAYAAELFALTDQNRGFLRQWLPWLDQTRTVADTTAFIRGQLVQFSEDRALHLTIFHVGKIAGVVGFNTIDPTLRSGTIGYWLGEDCNGRGIMTAAVRDLMRIGREIYDLNRIEIRCATGNTRSRAIPERLGFVCEGVLAHAEKVNEAWYDLAVYADVASPAREA